MSSWPNIAEGQSANSTDAKIPFPTQQGPVQLVVPLLKVTFSEPELFRVSLHPLRSPGVAPNPTGLIYSSQPAGGKGLLKNDVIEGQPPAQNTYVLLRWGTGAYQQELVADWPREGVVFDLACDSVQVDGLLRSGNASGVPVRLAASLSPGQRNGPASPLQISQAFGILGDAAMLSVPSYATRVTIGASGSIADTLSLAIQFRDGCNDPVAEYAGPGRYLVPSSAVFVVIQDASGLGALDDCYANWEIAP